MDPLKLEYDVEVDKWGIWADADDGLKISSWRDGSPAGDSILASGQPGCGLNPVDMVGVVAERSWTSSRGGLCVIREAEGCL